jgi:hypothetical protein
MKQLRRGTGYEFFRGHKKREQDVVAVLKDLIVGKFLISFRSDTCEELVVHTTPKLTQVRVIPGVFRHR